MQNPVDDPPDAYEKTEWAFARLRYRSGYGRWRGGSWGTDSNKAERQFSQGVRRLTRVHTRSVEEIIDVDSDEVYNWPWLYAVEVGHWQLSQSQANGFAITWIEAASLWWMIFTGRYEWDVFMAGLKQIFPDRPWLRSKMTIRSSMSSTICTSVCRCLAASSYTPAAPTKETAWNRAGGRFSMTRARIQVAICHNMDLGDAWEWADSPDYPEKYASLAYRIGINYIVYSMTH